VRFFKGGALSANGGRTGLCRSFSGLVGYLVQGRGTKLDPNRVAWVSYRNLDGIDRPAQAARVMRAHAGENPRVEAPVYHCGLSLYPDEHLSHEQWNQAVDRVLRRLGAADHQALVVAHRDTGHEHVHVVVNRVGDDFRGWYTHNDLIKAGDAMRRIELDYGLTRPDALRLGLPELSFRAYQHALHSGRQPLADRVREQAAVAFSEAAGWRDLEQRLAEHGFRIEPAARPPGLVVTDGAGHAPLSGVDRALSGPKLADRFGESFLEHRRAHPEPPAVVAPSPTSTPPPGASLEQRAAALIDRLTGTCATFTEADLHRAGFYQPESQALVREALRSDQLLDLGKDARGAHRYTTREYVDAESRLLAAAAGLASRDRLRLNAEIMSRSLVRTAPGLAEEPRAAVLHATAGADLAQIVGRAGAARAAVTRTIAATYQGRGYEVLGAALTARATAAMQIESGVPSRTIGNLERAWSEGSGRLHARSVLLLDEAGALGVRQLGRILAHAEERGAKVILLGDPDRLAAIGAGDAFRGLLEQHPSAGIDARHALADRHRPRRQAHATPETPAAGRAVAAGDSREQTGDRERLDQAVPRPGRKDLASDYAAADLRRAVARLQELAAKTAAATLELRPLRQVVAAFDALRDARLQVVAMRRSVAKVVALVYADPAQALHRLLRDPDAPARLREGKARSYGKFQRGAGLSVLRLPRAEDRPVVGSLTIRLETYREAVSQLQAAKREVRAELSANPGALSRSQPPAGPGMPPESRAPANPALLSRSQPPADPGLLPQPRAGTAVHELPGAAGTRVTPARLPRPAELRRELARVSATLHAHQQATRAAQDAIETAIRGMGRATLDSALLLLPPKAAVSVSAAARAVERAIGRTLDLGLGR
jgi:hypothetical protein